MPNITIAEVVRDYETDGVPSSGKHKPKKSDWRKWGAWVESIITAFTSNGGLIYSSLTSLNADLAHGANSMAWVLGDPVVANNGVYGKVGASGTGSWTRRSDLPFSFIIASDVGAGTPNAIQATTSIPVSGSALVWMNLAETNTSSPVTVQFNGGTVYTIKTNCGNNIAPNGLPSGMIVMGIVSGSTFRLVSDQVSSAIVAAAEAAQVAAEAAQAAAEAALASVNLPPLGAPLSVMRTKLDGSGRENYDPLATGSVASFGQPSNNDFSFPFKSGRFSVANKWADGPAAVDVASRDSSTWTLTNATRTLAGFSANIVPNTTNAVHSIGVATTIALAAGDTGFTALIAKANGYKFLRVRIDNYDEIVVDLSNGTVVKTPSVAGSLMQYTVVQLFNGWVYIAVSYTAAGAFNFNVTYYVNDNTGASGATTYAGDGTSGIQMFTASVRQQTTLPGFGVLETLWRGGNSYDITQFFHNYTDGNLYRRWGQGSPVRWSAWATLFDDLSLSAPAYVAKNRLIDRNDIRDYQTGIDLFGTSGNAVDKFKAAAAAFTDDGQALSVLRVPRGRIRFGDTWLITKMGFKMEGAGRQHWSRPYGETTGGSAHPLMGTQIETVGAGVARRWSDVDGGGAGDAAKKPVIAIAMPGVDMRGFSIVTPRTGTAANIWDNGIRLLGVDGCKFKEFNVYGGYGQAGIMLDATHSMYNTAMNAIIDGHGLANARDTNLMSRGITDNLFEDFEASGVSAIKLQGTTRTKGTAGQFNETTWLWAPNGVSDTKFKKFRLYQFGDDATRKGSGALIYLDHRLWNGGTPNSSGQNIAFENGRLDGAGKWAIYLENIDVVWFRQLFGETSGLWFDAQAQRSIIERTAATGGARIFSQCQLFFNYVVNGGAEQTPANNFYDGRAPF